MKFGPKNIFLKKILSGLNFYERAVGFPNFGNLEPLLKISSLFMSLLETVLASLDSLEGIVVSMESVLLVLDEVLSLVKLLDESIVMLFSKESCSFSWSSPSVFVFLVETVVPPPPPPVSSELQACLKLFKENFLTGLVISKTSDCLGLGDDRVSGVRKLANVERFLKLSKSENCRKVKFQAGNRIRQREFGQREQVGNENNAVGSPIDSRNANYFLCRRKLWRGQSLKINLSRRDR